MGLSLERCLVVGSCRVDFHKASSLCYMLQLFSPRQQKIKLGIGDLCKKENNYSHSLYRRVVILQPRKNALIKTFDLFKK